MFRTKKRKERGQALVEFALTLPILLMFLLGILDFGRVLFTYAEVSNNLRQALRQAANVGYTTRTYLDCERMIDIANNVTIAPQDLDVTVIYHLDNGTDEEPCVNTGDIDENDVVNGDFIEINVTATIGLWIMPAEPIELNFTGRRTIVTSLQIGAIANDDDFDGLNDNWEVANFGNTAAQNGLSDPDNDTFLNGAEEACGSLPLDGTSTCDTVP